MGKGQQPITSGHIVEQCALWVGTVSGDHRAGDQCCRRDGFRRQPTTNFGHHRHHLDRSGLIRVEAQSQDADLGELLPDFPAPAEVGVDGLVPAFGVVAAGEHLTSGVGQHLLFFGQVKVHRRVPISL